MLTLSEKDKRWIVNQCTKLVKKELKRSKPPKLMTPDEAAAYLCITTRTLQELAKDYKQQRKGGE
jgi:hypothetical protein